MNRLINIRRGLKNKVEAIQLFMFPWKYNEWFHLFELSFGWNFHHTYNHTSHSDIPHPMIHTTLGMLLFPLGFINPWLFLLCLIPYGHLFISIPIETKVNDYTEDPQYGFYWYTHGLGTEQLWFWWGIKYYVISMPWHLEWYRTSVLLKPVKNDEENWEHEYKGQKKDFYNDEWKDKKLSYKYLFRDKYDGTSVPCTITVGEREWRRKWWYKYSWFNFVKRYIDVEFHKEVGRKKGSWKGGVTGASWKLKPGQHPYEALHDMENNNNY